MQSIQGVWCWFSRPSKAQACPCAAEPGRDGLWRAYSTRLLSLIFALSLSIFRLSTMFCLVKFYSPPSVPHVLAAVHAQRQSLYHSPLLHFSLCCSLSLCIHSFSVREIDEGEDMSDAHRRRDLRMKEVWSFWWCWCFCWKTAQSTLKSIFHLNRALATIHYNQ